MGNIKKPTNPVPLLRQLDELLRQLDEEEEPLPIDGTETAFAAFYKKTPKYSLKNMFCTKCGKEVQEGVSFCKFCGQKIASPIQRIIQRIEEESLNKKRAAKKLMEMTRNKQMEKVEEKEIPPCENEVIYVDDEVPQENIMKPGQDFFEKDSIKDTDNADSAQVKKQWNTFVMLFWLLFALKFISNMGAETAQDESIVVFIRFLLPFVATIGMVILMGYFSYKFSGKKSYWLFGLLGLLWIAIIGIFLGFFQVQRLKNQRLGVKTSMKNFRLSK